MVSTLGKDGRTAQLSAPLFVDATGRDALIANRRQLKVADGLVTTNVAVHTMFQAPCAWRATTKATSSSASSTAAGGG